MTALNSSNFSLLNQTYRKVSSSHVEKIIIYLILFVISSIGNLSFLYGLLKMKKRKNFNQIKSRIHFALGIWWWTFLKFHIKYYIFISIIFARLLLFICHWKLYGHIQMDGLLVKLHVNFYWHSVHSASICHRQF